ncbi:MAG: ABC transporter permease [Bacteroidetes bacterium]|nr:ABC transporter permease [Bacteroidota bacterium]
MRTLLYLLRKEFSQIVRNRLIVRAIFILPLLQMLVLVPAVTFEIKDVRITISDGDLSQSSRQIASMLDGSEFFTVTGYAASANEAAASMSKGECDVIVSFLPGFEKNIITGTGSVMQVTVNAINAVSAQLTWAYINAIIRDYSMAMADEAQVVAGQTFSPPVKISTRYWYNSSLDYKYYMLPGVLVILVTAIGFLLSGLNMVREKETGTIEQMNVTPVRKYQFIMSKMIPFLIIGLIELSLGLIIGRIAFGIPFEGSLFTMFLGATLFLAGLLGLALFISSFSDTQQQYMFIAFFFTMIFILMSGIFTPAESMPAWAQNLNIANPVAHLMKINRMVMLKGSDISDITPELKALTVIALLFTLLAVLSYRKRA